MQKTRHLMDKNGAYFQMLIILLTFIEIGCGLRYNESEELQRLVVCIVIDFIRKFKMVPQP